MTEERPEFNVTPNTYKEFNGNFGEQMSALIAEGRTPMNIAQLAKRKLEVENFDMSGHYGSEKYRMEVVKECWARSEFYTGDAVVYFSTGEAKIVLDSSEIKRITPKWSGGPILLSDCSYEMIYGNNVYGFSWKNYPIDHSDTKNKQKILDNRVLRILHRHPDEVHEDYAIPGLHEEVVSGIFSKENKSSDYSPHVFISLNQYREPDKNSWRNAFIAPWVLDGRRDPLAFSMEDFDEGSYLIMGSYNFPKEGRLIGILDEREVENE